MEFRSFTEYGCLVTLDQVQMRAWLHWKLQASSTASSMHFFGDRTTGSRALDHRSVLCRFSPQRHRPPSRGCQCWVCLWLRDLATWQTNSRRQSCCRCCRRSRHALPDSEHYYAFLRLWIPRRHLFLCLCVSACWLSNRTRLGPVVGVDPAWSHRWCWLVVVARDRLRASWSTVLFAWTVAAIGFTSRSSQTGVTYCFRLSRGVTAVVVGLVSH